MSVTPLKLLELGRDTLANPNALCTEYMAADPLGRNCPVNSELAVQFSLVGAMLKHAVEHSTKPAAKAWAFIIQACGGRDPHEVGRTFGFTQADALDIYDVAIALASVGQTDKASDNPTKEPPCATLH